MGKDEDGLKKEIGKHTKFTEIELEIINTSFEIQLKNIDSEFDLLTN